MARTTTDAAGAVVARERVDRRAGAEARQEARGAAGFGHRHDRAHAHVLRQEHGGHGDAVVDAELRVNGVQGLRIADASVMPDLVGGNINAAVIMIAEKAADMIRGNVKSRQP